MLKIVLFKLVKRFQMVVVLLSLVCCFSSPVLDVTPARFIRELDHTFRAHGGKTTPEIWFVPVVALRHVDLPLYNLVLQHFFVAKVNVVQLSG